MQSPESLYQVWYELTSTIEDGIVILNTSDIICHLNKGISQLFPIASEDFRGTKFNEFIEEVVLPVIRNPKIASSEIFHLTSSNRTNQDIQIVSGPGKGHSVEFSIREGDNPDFP